MSQKEIVLKELRTTGAISRNWCLKNYITRLSAIIYNLKSEGYKFIEEGRRNGRSEDYIYYLSR